MSATDLFDLDVQKKIYDGLMPEPVEELTGVIQRYPAPPAGAADAFCFRAWRTDSGMRAFPLHLQLAPGLELPVDFAPYSVHRVSARFFEVDRIGLCMEIYGPIDNDEHLDRLAERLKSPVTFHDEQLGLFSRSLVLDHFDGEVVWNDKPVELSLEPEPGDPSSEEVQAQLKEAAGYAKTMLTQQKEWQERIVDFAAQELLQIKNESWREVNEPYLTAEEFKNRITLKSIGLSSWGSFSFWFDDGDLFWGHDINVIGYVESGPDHAEFCG